MVMPAAALQISLQCIGDHLVSLGNRYQVIGYHWIIIAMHWVLTTSAASVSSPTSSRSKSRKSNLCRSGQRSHLNFSDEVGQSEEEDVLAYTVSQLSISPENTIFHFLHLDVGEVGRFFRQITHAYIFQFCRACFWRPLCPRLVRITLKCWTTSGYQFNCDFHYEQIIILSIIFN